MIDHAAAAINAIRQLGATGLSGGKPVLLVGGEPLDVRVVPEGGLDLHRVMPCRSRAASSR